MQEEKIIGIVTDNKDPAKSGRIKAAIPQMDGDSYPEWINPVWPAPWIVIPNVNDEVEIVLPDSEDAIEFAEEIYYRGYTIDESKSVPDEFKTNYPDRMGFKTKAGHILIVDSKSGQEEITLSHKGVMLVSLTNSGIFFGTQNAEFHSGPVQDFVCLFRFQTGMYIDRLNNHSRIFFLRKFFDIDTAMP